jgi:hypothetical protein
MIDLNSHESSQEIENIIRAAFPIQDPTPSFIERLQKNLGDRLTTSAGTAKNRRTLRSYPQRMARIKSLISPLGWGAISFLLILLLIWGINTLIPRIEAGINIEPSPSPMASPSPQLPTIANPSLDHAVIYTVEQGDSLASIEQKTGVPMETIHTLNVFVFQTNDLIAGLRLLIGFKGQIPVFYTVKERDTILGISDKAGISIEEFSSLNRLGVQTSGSLNTEPVPQYKLTPGIRVMIGLEKVALDENESSGDNLIILSEVDLNCDNQAERILGVEQPEIEYFNITPQLSTIILERNNETGYEKVWQQSAQEAGVAYLAYRLFQAEGCNRFLVVLGHKGKESLNVYRWDGEHMISVLHLSGRFLFEGDWMQDVFGNYKSANTLMLGELQQPTSSSKNIWILRGYRWVDDEFILKVERRVELGAGG